MTTRQGPDAGVAKPRAGVSPVPISEHLAGIRALVGSRLLLIPAVAAIVCDAAGAVLLQRRSDNGLWSLPGGALDPGEAPGRAVVREVWEETGLLVRPVRLLGVFAGLPYRTAYPNGDLAEPCITVFGCERLAGHLEALDGESLELRYFPPDALPELPLPYPRELLRPWPAATAPAFDWHETWLDGLEPAPGERRAHP